MLELNQIHLGDCLELMKEIPDNSIDMILCDPPYGVLDKKHHSWDCLIDLEKLWTEYNRVIKHDGAIVLFGKQPFTSTLILSQPKLFRYELIWEKDKGTDFGHANHKPLNAHENMIVFFKKQPTYNKQMEKGEPYTKINKQSHNKKGDTNFECDNSGTWINDGVRTPKSVIKIARDNIHKGKNLHPTQKPVALCEWLIKSYTNENEVVLDNCAGSGSTLIAAKNLNRQFIGIEKDEHYFNVAKERLNNAG